jgi:flagellar motor switch protein FliG
MELLELADQSAVTQIIQDIEGKDPELAEEIKNRLPKPASSYILSDNEMTQMLSNLNGDDGESKQDGKDSE